MIGRRGWLYAATAFLVGSLVGLPASVKADLPQQTPGGGLYGPMGSPGQDWEDHHTPAKNSWRDSKVGFNPWCGPSIRMHRLDHYRTASHGTGTRMGGDGVPIDVEAFRRRQAELIAEAARTGDNSLIRRAIQMDIDNIVGLMRPTAPNLQPLYYDYTAAIEQMLAAWERIKNYLGQLDDKCRPPTDPAYTGAASWTTSSAFAAVKAPEEEGAEQQEAVWEYNRSLDPSYHAEDGTYC